MSDHAVQRQLTLDIAPHPHVARLPDGGWLQGSLKVNGSYAVHKDLNPGDAVTVTIADADGTVISSAQAEVGPISFVPIRLEGEVIGTERHHKAKIYG